MSVTSSLFEREKVAEVDVQQFVRNPDVLVDNLKFINALSLDDAVPNIQFSSSSINVEITTTHNAFSDHQGYFTTFAQEMDFIAKMENLAEKGKVLIHLLYTYRSVSQAIPEISMDLPADATAEQQADAAAKRAEINRKVLDILRPEIVKVKQLIAYLVEAVSLFHSVITHLVNKEANKEVVPEGIHMSLMKLMDVVLILDNLKDIKTCLQKDFSRYKRVVGAHPSIEILEEVTQLQTFLSNPDPRKAKNYVFLSMRDEVKRVSGHENVLLDGLEHAVDTLEKGYFVTPEEQFRLVRVLPYYILIADGEADDAKSFNIFKTSKIKLPTLQKVFKKYPVVPLYADMNMVMELVLHRSAHYNTAKLGSSWGAVPVGSAAPVMQPHYDLRMAWAGMRDAYSVYMTRFSASINRFEKYPFHKALDEVSVDMSASVYALVVDGLQLVARWAAQVKLMLSWKYTHPCSPEAMQAQLAEAAGGAHGASSPTNTEGAEYARVLRYNLTRDELSVLVDAISMIKALSSLMTRSEATLSPYLRFHVHHRIQYLVQGELTPLLHRLDKRNKPILPTLLSIRSLVADWSEGSDPLKDYKEYSRKQSGGAIKVNHPPRVVGPAPSQLFILRTQLSSLCDSDSELRRKTSIFGKADLEKSELELFQRFYTDSFYYSYALNYVQTLAEVSDLADMWYREHFLEMTRCIQFPIEMSLPWILTEHLLLKHVSNAPMLESVLFVLDVYNDAAHRALYVLNQQYLYDEIEAEANLVIDQLYFLLSDEVYTHYKNLAASTHLEMSLKNKLELLKGANHLTVDARRMDSLLSQRHIQLLGRSINFSFILGQNINNKIYRDIDFAIKRFEASDARAIVELKTLLDIIADTHARLSQFLALDAFDTMLSEVNESFSPSSFRGRISLHMLSSLAKDIFPNFSYNLHTHRFIPSPIAIRPMQYSKAPKQSAVSSAFGSVCGKVYEMCGRLTRSFFGLPHLEAYLSLGVSVSDLSMLVDQCMKNMFDKIVDVSEYLEALKDGVPPCPPPKTMFHSMQTAGGYGYYEGKLRSILDYDDLKPEVFQNFREIGNSLAFLTDLSDALEVSDQFSFLMLAPFLGCAPTGSFRSAGDGGPVSMAAPTTSPVLKVVSHVAAELKASTRLQAEAVRAADVWARLPSVVQRLSEASVNSLGAQAEGGERSGRSLIKHVLVQVEEFLYQENLAVEWASIPSEPSAEPFAVKNATGFHRLWSALNFLFCIVDGAGETAVSAGGGEVPASATLISNEAEFGHGFTIAGCALLHLLGQRATFDVLDFSAHVLQLDAHERRVTEAAAAPAAKLDESLLRETTAFVYSARTQRLLQQQLFAQLEVLHKTRDSYTKHSTNSMVFHPPAEA